MQHYGAIYLENELFFIVCFKVVPRRVKNYNERWCYFAYGQVPQAKAFKGVFQRGLKCYPCGVMRLLLIKLPRIPPAQLPGRKASMWRNACTSPLLIRLVTGFQDICLSLRRYFFPKFKVSLSS